MPKHGGAAPLEAEPVAVPPLTVEDIALRLGCAAAFGIAAALAYYLTQRKTRAQTASFVSMMVLLAVLLGMVSMVIGTNIAQAFALMGVLSIVRFRTVVEDTRDTAFVIFAVVVGMAAGAGAYLVAAIGIPIVGLVAWLLAWWGRSGDAPASATQNRLTTVVIRVGIGTNPEGVLAAVLAKHADATELVAAGVVRQGTALDLTYSLRLREKVTPLALIGELNKTEGVQGVDWKQKSSDE